MKKYPETFTNGFMKLEVFIIYILDIFGYIIKFRSSFYKNRNRSFICINNKIK